MAGSENGAGATGAGTGAGAGPAGGTVAGYTRFPVVKPVPHLPTMQGLQSGLNYDFPPDFVPSDMWSACASGRWAYVVKELDKDPSVVHKADLSGQTVLHWACLHGANVIAQRVLDMGSSLNVLSGNGQTPFMWAAIQSQLDTMELLRQHNVDMEVHDDNGATALLLSVQHKRPLSLLALLDMGADIDATDNQGCGVAHYAASVGCVEVLRILKHRKYPLNKLDNRGMLPLHRAARSDQGDVVDFLVDNHNDPLLRAEGKTPREMAKEMKNHYVVSRLMRAERRVKKMQGSIIDQVMMHIKSGKERDRWAWCAGWVVNFMGSLIVYWSNLVPATASHTTLSMLFVVCMVVLGVTYPMLTLGNPGKVTEDTPKYPGDRRATRRSRSNHRLDRQSKSEPGDEEAGLIPNRNFVTQLSDGMTGLAKDQRAGFVCFSCELLKPLRSKHCASCDMCVERMDHHCVWINNCVGAGNIRLFNLFCIAQTLAVTVFTFFSCKVVYLLWGHSLGIIHFLRSLLFLYKLMLFHTLINFGGIFMTGMIVYSQWVNMAKNLTTNEEINMMRYEHFWREFQTEDGRRGKRFVNPFSRDRLTNWMEFWGLVDPKTVTTQEIIKIIQDNATLRERDQELFGVDPSAMLSGGGGGGHGHSHGGEGGHGHSHGGDDNHGHSHGGGDDHGHSHSGGDGGHGHSHGGDGGHGHSH